MQNFDPEKCLIFEAIAGSRLYGTETPASDFDIRSICIPPKEVLLNPFMNFNQKDSGFKEEDRCIYALGQFVKLCADANPNILELLFIPDNKIVFNSKIWKRLLDFKYLFISKKIKHTFSGYAMLWLSYIK